MAGGRAARRLEVRFDELVCREAVRGSPFRHSRCAGCGKLYLPRTEAPAFERPFALVLQLARDTDDALVWVFIAFGLRHPGAGIRSVYERAHRQLHGRLPE